MKILRTMGSSLALSMLSVFVFFACQQEEVVKVDASSVDKAKINALVVLSDKSGASEEEIQHFANGFKLLNFEEFEAYNELKLQRELQKIGDDPALKATIENARAYQKEVNKRSMAAYGVPYNQLDGAKINALLGEESQSAASAGGKVASCPIINFPYNYYRGYGLAYVGRSKEILRVSNDGSDCDYQYSFSTINYTKLHPFNPGTINIINYYGSLIARRVNGYTYILIGNRAIALYFLGNASGVDLYLGT